MSQRRVQIHHDKHHNRVLLAMYDETVSLSVFLTPREAEEIGAVGHMASTYEQNTESDN